MSAVTSSFATAARSGSAKPVTINYPRVTFNGEHTIMKLCAVCGQQMPHRIGAQKCILCDGNDPPAERKDDD